MLTLNSIVEVALKLVGIVTLSQRCTWNAAKAIGREDLGNLSVGSVADIAILGVRTGEFGFIDAISE